MSEAWHGQAIDVEVADGVKGSKRNCYPIKVDHNKNLVTVIDLYYRFSNPVNNIWQKGYAVDKRHKNCCDNSLPLQSFSAAVSYLFSNDEQVTSASNNLTSWGKYE